jgi:peptide/nickel transport system permease protein
MAGEFLARRVGHLAIVLVGVVCIVFLMLRLAPGDPAQLMLPPDAPPTEIQRLRTALGLNRPLYVQLSLFLWRAFHGDVGRSFSYGEPALSVALSRVPATAELAMSSLAISVVVGVPLGILSALRRDTLIDYAASVMAVFGQAVPVFWFGLMGILVFSSMLHWVPSSGAGGLRYIILPSLVLGVYFVALITRLARSGMLEVLSEDYVRTARSKGVSEHRVVIAHAFRNAVLPLLTVLGLQMASLLSGAVVTETVFAWPGIGQLTMDALSARDYPLVQAIVLIVAAVFLITNLLVDVSYAYFDPRIRFGSA